MDEVADNRLFKVRTPFGFSVRTTVPYWTLIEAKHPKLRGCSQDVAQVIATPDQIYQRQHDSAVYLFYAVDEDCLLCAVVKRLDGEGFLVPHAPRQDQGRRAYIAQIRVIHDPIGQTLTIHWDDPEREEICEEIGQGIILIKDAQGEVIGFERLYFRPSNTSQELGVVLQMARA